MVWRTYYGRHGGRYYFETSSKEEAFRRIEYDENAGNIYAHAVRDMKTDKVFYRNSDHLEFNWVETDLAGANKILGRDLDDGSYKAN